MNMQKPFMFITGASRGIGEAAALLLSKDYHIILSSRSENDLKSVRDRIISIGGTADVLVSDFSSVDSAVKTAEEMEKKFGIPDTVLLNAGISTNKDFENQLIDNMILEMNVNYLSPMAFLKTILPRMIGRKYGNIITVGSVASIIHFPGNSTYAAIKSAMLSMTMSLNMELKRYGIFAGCVLPGITETDMTKAFHSVPFLPISSPKEVAECIEETLRNKNEMGIPGAVNQILTAVYKAAPGPIHFILKNSLEFILPEIQKRLKNE